jgi:DNA mismatch repair protein PMS2
MPRRLPSALNPSPLKSGKISSLSSSDANKLCSGQVILDLATSIKELVENAVDAHATSIDVLLEGRGVESITVTDNGTGIAPDDFEHVARKGATSKITSFADILTGVESFGFRGEALASLAGVAGSLEMVTRRPVDDAGSKLTFDADGELVSVEPVAAKTGTVVRVARIFDRLPVRRVELERHDRREYQKAIAVLQQYAITLEGVRLLVSNAMPKGPRQTVLLCQGRSMRDNLATVFDGSFVETLLRVDAETTLDDDEEGDLVISGEDSKNDEDKPDVVEGFKLSGYISKPGRGRSNGDRQFFYVNRRPVDTPRLARLVNEVYRQRTASRNFPACFLHVQMPPSTVDVNITPNKRSILMQREMAALDFIRSALEGVFADSAGAQVFAADAGQAQADLFRHFTRPAARAPRGSLSSGSNEAVSPPPSTDTVTRRSRRSPVQAVLQPVPVAVPEPEPEPVPVAAAAPGPAASADGDDDDSAPGSLQDSSADDEDVDIGSDKDMEEEDEAVGGDDVSDEREVDVGSMGQADDSENDVSEVAMPATMPTPTQPKRKVADLADVVDGESSEEVEEAPITPVTKVARRSTGRRPPVQSLGSMLDAFASDAPGADEVATRVAEMQRSARRNARSSSVIGGGSSSPMHSSPDTSPIKLTPTKVVFDDEEEAADLVVPPAAHSDSRSIDVLAASVDDIHRLAREAAASAAADAGDEGPGPVMDELPLDAAADSDNVKRMQSVFERASFANLHVIGQFNLGFIVCRLGNELYVVDQHAADEKTNYERLLTTTKLNVQQLLVPLRLDLTEREIDIVEESADIFRANGFNVTVEGVPQADGSVVRRASMLSRPFTKAVEFNADDVHDLIERIQTRPHGAMVRPGKFNSLVASRACRSSIMVGTALSEREQTRVVHGLQNLYQPYNCPHGRPTIRQLTSLASLRATGMVPEE